VTLTDTLQYAVVRTRVLRERPLWGYGATLVLVATALAIRVAAGSAWTTAPFLTFFIAALIAAFAGVGPGLTAVVVGAGSVFWFMTPSRSFFVAVPNGALSFGAFFVSAITAVVLVSVLVKLVEANATLAARAEALLAELQHRVKNHIQIVASLLNLQASRVDPETRGLLAQVVRRISTISSAYSHLYRSDNRIDFAQHLREISDAAEGSPRALRTIEVTADAILWGMDVVMPLSLIASEFIDNALRHGLAKGPGRVLVSLVRRDDQFVLAVADDGARLPPDFDLVRDAALGLQLVSAMSRRLRGEVQVARGEMTTFAITFPP
jgi:two-component sensor histidine kinase